MRGRTKYRHSFDRVLFENRWKSPFYSRHANWLIIGISTRYFSTTEYEYRIGFFGFDLRIWMKRTAI